MKINFIYPRKNDISFTTPFIDCEYYNKEFSIVIGFLFWGIDIKF